MFSTYSNAQIQRTVNNSDALSFLKSVQHRFGNDDRLLSGEIYLQLHKNADGHPFYLSDQPIRSTFFQNSIRFPDQKAYFDILSDEFIVQTRIHNDAILKLRLNHQKNDSVYLGDHLFINARYVPDADSGIHYYEKLYKDELALYAGYQKVFIGNYSQSNPYGKFSDTYRSYFLYKDGELQKLQGKRHLYALFPDQKQGVRRYIRQNRIRYKKASSYQMGKLVSFIDENYHSTDTIKKVSATKVEMEQKEIELIELFTTDLIQFASDTIDTIKTNQSEQQLYLTTKKEYVAETRIIGNRKKGAGITKAFIQGYVRSSEDQKAIAYATLFVEELGIGTSTDIKGFYQLGLPKGRYTLRVKSIECIEKKFQIVVHSSDEMDIDLDRRLVMLNEVEISSDKHHHVKGAQMGFEKINIRNIKEIPAVLGEKDIIKVSLLLPGVQSVGEGASGFNVRGSPADQNLFYINQIPVYNTAHFFGFFSSFNAEAISDFTLIKSNIPAKYGGRLSSIFDIKAKQGRLDGFSARGGISPITANLMVEGPISKNKSSYMLGVRSTYSDWVMKMVDNVEVKNSSAYFGDIMGNLSFSLDEKNHLKTFFYASYDRADIYPSNTFNYGNTGASVIWQHQFSPTFDGSLSVVHNSYNFAEENSEFSYGAYKQSYALGHSEMKLDFSNVVSEKHLLGFGIHSAFYQIRRGDFLPLTDESDVIPKSFEPEQALESSVYISDDWEINPLFVVNGGVRLNHYRYLGPKTVYSYIPNVPREIHSIHDTTNFGSGSSIANYTNVDVRLGARYLLNENLSVKAAYNTLHQHIFMLSNTIAIAPNDRWKLVDSHIKPLSGQQLSTGLYTTLFRDKWEASVEFYGKTADNVVDFKDGANLVVNEIPETDVLQGKLEAYGVELMLKKKTGRLRGWINYTYSRASILVDQTETGENINFGISYPANYEKPHALNAVINYSLSRRASLSTNLVYSTGRPISYPTAIYFQDGMQITHYSLRNEYRIPDYFRWDVSLTFEGNLKSKKLAHGSFIFSVYNLTGRKNAYSVFFRNENGKIKSYKLSIFGAPIFSVTYQFKLGNYEN